MATTRVITGACIVLFFLILCHEVVHVEGRPLKSVELCKKCSTNNDNSQNVPENGNHGLTAGQEQTSKVKYVDDFRPTEPGHSPGVGHSVNNWTSNSCSYSTNDGASCLGLKSWWWAEGQVVDHFWLFNFPELNVHILSCSQLIKHSVSLNLNNFLKVI